MCPKHALCGVFLSFFVLSLLSSGAQAQSAQDAIDDAKREQARIDRLWVRAWRDFAPFYVKHDGQFIYVPGYDKRLPSSVGMTERDYQQKEKLEQEYTDERGKEQKRTLTKSEEEARAAVALLPEVAVGKYGYIHSGKIAEIADDKTLMLEDLWLLDAQAVGAAKAEREKQMQQDAADTIEQALRDRGRDFRRDRGDGFWTRQRREREEIDWQFAQRMAAADRQGERVFSRYQWKVIGYRTDPLVKDERWPAGKAAEAGLQLVIVSIQGDTVTALPTAMIGKDITELDFLNLLEARSITKNQFVELVSEAKRTARGDYMAVVLARLEGLELPEGLAAEPEDARNDVVELAD